MPRTQHTAPLLLASSPGPIFILKLAGTKNNFNIKIGPGDEATLLYASIHFGVLLMWSTNVTRSDTP